MNQRTRRSVLGTGAAVVAAIAACGRSGAAPPVHDSPTPSRSVSPPPAPARRVVPPHEIRHGPRDGTGVALTFHGSGDPALTERALTVLRRERAHVTVLAVGTWLAANPALAQRITADGHDLGNHTYTHPVLPDLDGDAARTEIERCRDLLRTLTGSPGRWFRPSGTPRATPLILRVAAAAGYPVCLAYDVDPLDYADPGAGAVRERVATVVRPGSIVSLHLYREGTVEALPGILADLRGRGLVPVTVSDLVRAT
jgi:peptidoglycan/xylan/chitin deacetylase (PgdA/CDA1 family)